jgi:CBS domain-containing protein
MYVSEVMTENPSRVSMQCSVLEAAKKMRDENCGVLPVMDGERVAGVITDRDLIVYAVAEDKPLTQCQVADIMSTDVVTCRQDETLEHIADRMSMHDIRRLIVLDAQNRLTGIVSVHDLLVNTGDRRVTGEVIHHVLQYA